MKKPNFNTRRFKYGTISTVITIVFVVAVILVNIVASMLLKRYPTKIDLTYNKLYELSSVTTDYIKDLNKEVTITVLQDDDILRNQINDGGKQLVEVLEKYDLYSNNINVKFIDPDKEPNELQKLSYVYSGDLSDKLVVIQCGEKAKAYVQTDLINYERNMNNFNLYTVTSNAEQTITSAIMYITDDNPIKISVFQSAEEVFPVGNFENLLSNFGYEIEIVDALSGTIDPKSSFVIVNCPLSDFSEEQIKKLDSYLYNDGKLGKNMIYLASFGQQKTPNIDAFLADWGISVGDGYVIETDQNYSYSMNGGGVSVISTIKDNEYTIGLEKAANPLIVPYSRPIELLLEQKDNRKTLSLLSTSPAGMVIPSDADETLDLSTLPTGNINMMALATKTANAASSSDMTESKMFVIGSPLIFSSNYTTSNTLNNTEYPIHVVNKITGKGSGVSLVSKTITDSQLEISIVQKNVIKYLATLILPVIIIGLGTFIWARRRRR